MKHLLVAAFSAVMLSSVSFAGDKVELKDLNDKVNYSIGYQIGGDFKRQGIPIRPDIIIRGIQDALGSAPPVLTPQEMQTTLVDLKKRITAAQQQELNAAAAKNLAQGKRFLAENAKKQEVITLPSGLQYKVIREGSGKAPKADDTLTVNYRGTLVDGTEFDSSYKRNKPATFRADRVIAGWKEALPLMREGAKWQLFIPPELAYGERRAGAKIAPNSTLIFEVELISIQPSEK